MFVQKLIQFSLCFSLIIAVICPYFSVFFFTGFEILAREEVVWREILP